MDEEGLCVDAETRVALLELKTEIIEAVTSIVKTSNSELEKTLKELHDLRFKNLEKEMDRSFKYHEEHYKAVLLLNEKIEALSSRQSKDEGGAETAEKMSNFQQNKTIIIWTAAGVILAVIGTLGVSTILP